MAKHRNAVSVLCRVPNVASACNSGGGSSLHTRIKRYSAHDAAAAMRSNAPQNQPPFPAARVKHTEHASSGASSAAHSRARAPLQPHLHSPHATPRHTLHHLHSPAPRPVDHVGRRGGQPLARERHTGEHEAHWNTRRTFRDNGAEGRQRLLPTVMRKKPLLAFEELERAHDWCEKLLGRLQYAVGDEDKSAGEAIGK